jgi:hypothetical protein
MCANLRILTFGSNLLMVNELWQTRSFVTGRL